MAEIAGHSGDVTFTDFQTTAKSFTIEHTADLEDVTAFDGDTGYKKYLPLLKDWTATIEMNWSSSNSAIPAAASATLTLTVDGTSKYTGSAYLQSISINEAVDGVVTQTGVFQGTGALVLS